MTRTRDLGQGIGIGSEQALVDDRFDGLTMLYAPDRSQLEYVHIAIKYTSSS